MGETTTKLEKVPRTFHAPAEEFVGVTIQDLSRTPRLEGSEQIEMFNLTRIVTEPCLYLNDGHPPLEGKGKHLTAADWQVDIHDG